MQHCAQHAPGRTEKEIPDPSAHHLLRVAFKAPEYSRWQLIKAGGVRGTPVRLLHEFIEGGGGVESAFPFEVRPPALLPLCFFHKGEDIRVVQCRRGAARLKTLQKIDVRLHWSGAVQLLGLC